MSRQHPIVAVTGSSGAGTSKAKGVLDEIFAQMGLNAASVEGDSFHAYDRETWRMMLERAAIRGEMLSLFGPQGNLFVRLEALFREYGQSATGSVRRYLHTEAEGEAVRQNAGTFTPWRRIPPGSDLLFYEGLHGGVVTKEVNVAQHVDLLIGVSPTVNLEWIQKIHRDTEERGYQASEVTAMILRRMPDYVTYLLPQFSRTDINFQRVPLVDTSNPFERRAIPAPEESLVVIHCNPCSRFDAPFGELLAKIPQSFASAPNTVVVQGMYQNQAMQLLLRDMLGQVMARKAG